MIPQLPKRPEDIKFGTDEEDYTKLSDEEIEGILNDFQNKEWNIKMPMDRLAKAITNKLNGGE